MVIRLLARVQFIKYKNIYFMWHKGYVAFLKDLTQTQFYFKFFILLIGNVI